MTREFMGMPIEGEQTITYSRRQYTPRPIEELYPYFKDAFDKGVTAVAWRQYTPYHNDGEPCEFSVHEVAVTNNKEVAENWLNGDFYEERLVEVDRDTYDKAVEEAKNSRYYYLPYEEIDGKTYERLSEGLYDYELSAYSKHPDGIEAGSITIPVDTLEFEDAVRATFGDHTQVVVTPDHVTQFEYSHD